MLFSTTLIWSFPAQAQQGTTFTTTTRFDSIDANPGDGICADANGECSLRAAIIEANRTAIADVIVLAELEDSVTTYELTLTDNPDDDINITGDLDIVTSMSIQGGNRDRILISTMDKSVNTFDINPEGRLVNNERLNVVISRVTIQNNVRVPDNDWSAQATIITVNANTDFTLSDSTVQQGKIGILSLEGAETVINNSISTYHRGSPSATAIRNNGIMEIIGSQSTENSIRGDFLGGAGIYNTGFLTIHSSSVLNNIPRTTAVFNGSRTQGAGIYNNVGLSLDSTNW